MMAPANCCRGRGIVLQCRAVARVEDRSAEIAQVAAPLGRGGNARQQRAAILLPGALVIAEEERLVLLNRSADRAAELIPQGGRNELAVSAHDRLGLGERVARGAMLVAPVPESAAMERVGAGFRLRGNHRLAGLPELGVVGRGGDFQFRHGVEIRSNDGFTQYGIAVIRAIQLEIEMPPQYWPPMLGPVDVLRLFAGGRRAGRLDAGT